MRLSNLIIGRILRTMAGLYGTSPAARKELFILLVEKDLLHVCCKRLRKTCLSIPVILFRFASSNSLLYALAYGEKILTSNG